MACACIGASKRTATIQRLSPSPTLAMMSRAGCLKCYKLMQAREDADTEAADGWQAVEARKGKR